MHIILKVEGAAPVATTLQAFLADNADSIMASEEQRIRASLLQHGDAFILGGGAAPLVTLVWAD